MDSFIFVGIGLLIAVLGVSVSDVFKHPATYLQFESSILVFGGVLALFTIASTKEDLKSTFGSMIVLVKGKTLPSTREIVDKLVELSIRSQKEGRTSLEDAGEGFDDGFLNNSLQMVVNKLHPDFIRVILQNEIDETDARHDNNIKGVKMLGELGPMCGMFGTIIGIIQVLANMTDPKSVGPAMSLALITSMYGVFIAGFISAPMASRLSKKSRQEILSKTIMLEGVLMIAKGEIPIKVETYLKGFLSNKEKDIKPAEEDNG
jgi:chemotaxis protein MotA